MAQLTVVLVGDETLLGQCGEMLLERGHRIALVVTGSQAIEQWASSHSIDARAWSGDLAELLRPLELDWLFSIANLRVVPDEALALARVGAVNFHDGPLPRYAGLNTPSWAILEGATSYGVTWHRMTAGIDRGNILARNNFDLDASETALTLNAKCFEAGIASFGDVLQRIESGDAAGEPQPDTERHHYMKTRRPEAAALVDFSADAAAIERLVRALDFGPGYANPLLTPKVATADGLFAVTTVEIVDEGGGRNPGTVVGVDGQGAVIATADRAVRVEGRSLADPERLLSAALRVGDLLPVQDAASRARATETVARLVPQEPAWRAALRPADDLSDKWGEASTGGAGHQALPLELPAGWTAAEAVPTIAAFFARHFGQSEFVLAYANDDIAATAAQVPGLAAEAVPLHVGLNLDRSSREARDRVAAAVAEVRERGTFLSDLFLRYPHLHRPAPAIGIVETVTPDSARPIDGCAITFAAGDGGVRMIVDTARIGLEEARELAGRIGIFAAGFGARDDALAALPTMSDEELRRLLVEFNDTARDYDRDACVHHLIEAQARRTPDATAVAFQGRSISYAELDRAAEAVAGVLWQHGVKPDVPVGLYIPRSIELVVGALAIMKAGGAYLPLDPDFPHDRLALMVEDSGAPVILTTSSLPPLQVPGERASVDIATAMNGAPGVDAAAKPASSNLAYVIYTSGSTGRPKGVMLEHRNVVNFFAGMDERIERGGDGQPVWLAVTSLSFDISVLELFWTLARGFKVVIHSSEVHRAHQAPAQERKAVLAKQLDFGLFYWGNDDGAGPAKYRLMLEGAKFADRNGFQAVWTPERHFHAFGGPYPNPSVSGAAVAAVTENLHIRAGSCVLPLHHPARVAEEWALVDNLSNGRVGLAFASGWMPEDFVLRPENQPPGNKAAMIRDIEVVRRLWRGEAVEFGFGEKSIPVVTQPRPVQSELPVWLTTAGNPDSYREAARLGANVLTHLLGQSIEELAGKIKIYRDTLTECGRDPDAFKVTLMLHTLVGDDREQVRDLAREPMKDYLRSAAALIKQYAWAFPAFKKPAGAANPMDIDLRDLAEDEMDAILEFAFERYFEDSGLFGTRDDCMRRLEQVSAIGVDEIACLIDYGVPSDVVLERLKPLADVVKQAREAGKQAGVANGDAVAPTVSPEGVGDAHGFAAEVGAHGVTHLQCTPSMMRMFLASDEDRAAVARIRHLMIGGEPLHGSLLAELRSITPAGVQNMYGPTETTIWSSTVMAEPTEGVVPIGLPIANTQLYVLDPAGNPVPPGAPGELHIGGDGVARGYLNRAELTAERFVPNPFAPGRMYRTGDLVQFERDGRTLRFIGRVDHQVKVRGYRIELGEIEARMQTFPNVVEAVVTTREDRQGDVRIIGYLRASGPVPHDGLRAHLAETLPDYMVPSRFIELESFPLTPNAKVDRGKLPYSEETAGAPAERIHLPPKDDTERSIADVFMRVLGVGNIGLTDNFFALGGHSLLAIQAHRELKQTIAPELTVTDLFRFPTVGGLASHLRDRGAADDRLMSVAERAAMRRNRMQQRVVTRV